MNTNEPEEAYAGSARVRAGSAEPIGVAVQLRGYFEPIDGHFHWYGRIAGNAVLQATTTSGSTVTLETPHGTAEGRLSDVDPWGRFKISGIGRPPF